MMKKLFPTLALAALLAAPAVAQIQVLNAAATSIPLSTYACGTANTSTAFASATTSRAYPLPGQGSYTFHVYSDAGSVASFSALSGPTSSGPWFDFTAATPITNPTAAAGNAWSIPTGTAWVKFSVPSWTSGTLRICITGRLGFEVIY